MKDICTEESVEERKVQTERSPYSKISQTKVPTKRNSALSLSNMLLILMEM